MIGNRSLSLVALLLALSSAAVLQAQQQRVAPAPVPLQITTAKKVFISNAGGDSSVSYVFSQGRDYAYDEFYAAMKNWGRVELVESPSEADVVLEIALNIVSRSGNVIKGDTVGPGYDAQLRLVALEPRTRVTLWAFTEHVEPAILKSNRDKNFETAMNALIEDTKGIFAKRE